MAFASASTRVLTGCARNGSGRWWPGHRHRHLVSTSAVCAFVLALTLVATGWLKFTFFPPVDGDQLRAVVEFSSGTDSRQVDRFLAQLETTLEETNEELGGHLVKTVISHHGAAAGFPNIGGRQDKFGDEYGTLVVEVYVGGSGDQQRRADPVLVGQTDPPAGLDQLHLQAPRPAPANPLRSSSPAAMLQP